MYDEVFYLNVANTCFENGELRLLGGETTREGRVEICIDQQWGTVCDNVWSNEDAQVVCRQLTLPSKGLFHN